jgi:hypothetical protein
MLEDFLDADDGGKAAEWIDKLPVRDGDADTWWFGMIMDASGVKKVARLAPSSRDGQPVHSWHTYVAELGPGSDGYCTTSIKPVTRHGVAMQLLHSGFDVRAARWSIDDEHRGSTDGTPHYVPGRDPDMYWGNPWSADHPEVLERHSVAAPGNRAARRAQSKRGRRG